YWIALFTFITLNLTQGFINSSISITASDFIPIISSIILAPTRIGDSYYPYLGIAWTLTFEFFFYLIYASLLVFKIKNRLMILSGLFLFLIIFHFIFNSYIHSPFFQYYTHPIILEFVLGCWIGYLIKQNKHLSYRLAITAIIVSIIAISFSSQLSGPFISFSNLNPWRVVFWGLPSALLVYAFVSLERIITNFSLRSMITLGDASYSLYLFHAALILPVLGFIFSTLNIYLYINIYMMVVVLSSCCICISVLIHKFIEIPTTSAIRQRISNENIVSPQNSI
ncbi:acyltransferase, partial [Photobacterium sp. BZF1]|uniref:acyltransferase family protein n=1 Tax=Photobacterium sp. BZF1 TaxID=1904457 RepID=UPI001653BB5E